MAAGLGGADDVAGPAAAAAAESSGLLSAGLVEILPVLPAVDADDGDDEEEDDESSEGNAFGGDKFRLPFRLLLLGMPRLRLWVATCCGLRSVGKGLRARHVPPSQVPVRWDEIWAI